jgi:hypothetical protein
MLYMVKEQVNDLYGDMFVGDAGSAGAAASA